MDELIQLIQNLVPYLACLDERLAQQPDTAARRQRARLLEYYREWLAGLLRNARLFQGARPVDLFPDTLLLEWIGRLGGLLEGYLAGLAVLNEAVETLNFPPPFNLPLEEIQDARNTIERVLQEVALFASDPTAPEPGDREERPYCSPLTEEEDQDALYIHRALASIGCWKDQQRMRIFLLVVSGELLPLAAAVGHHHRTRVGCIDRCRVIHHIPDYFR